MVPENIKSIQLRSLDHVDFSSVVPLGTSLELSFDDLDGDQKDYYYKIELMTHDWKKSHLISNQYLNGFQSNLIFNVENSFNTLQNYSHYSVKFPNQNTEITKSGNYLLSILNGVGDFVFARKFTLYEDCVNVGVAVTRSRSTKELNEEQTVHFSINHPALQIDNPSQEIHVAILQNDIWETAITNIRPQFYKPNQLIYKYVKETNFRGGNEYLFFDNKAITNTNISVASVELKEIYHSYVSSYINRSIKSYTFNPDINGQFVIGTVESSNPNTEADYAVVHFSLKTEQELSDQEVYVYGAFNNFELTEENKMIFNPFTNGYTLEILLKQGFYNYTFVAKSKENVISEAEIRGNFSKTENNYTVIVYQKAFGSLFDRVIGVGTVQFTGEY